MDSRSERGTPFITAKDEGQLALLEKSKSFPPFLFSSLTTWKFNVPTLNFGKILPPLSTRWADDATAAQPSPSVTTAKAALTLALLRQGKLQLPSPYSSPQ